MAVPINNTNAKKWTANKVWYQVSKVSKAVKNPEELFLGQVLERLGLYKDDGPIGKGNMQAMSASCIKWG
jgi:hypothetical protein